MPARNRRGGGYRSVQRGQIKEDYCEIQRETWIHGSGRVIDALAANLTPLTAQRDSFGEITCTGLRVVDSEGRDGVVLDAATGVAECLFQ